MANLHLQNILNHLLAFLFPRRCLHCHEPLIDVKKVICPLCVQQFEIVQTSGDKIAATFEVIGLAKTLCYNFEQTLDDALAKLIAACCVVRHSYLSWEMPDFLIPLPCISKTSFNKDQPADLLAKYLAYFFKRPIRRPFKVACEKEVFNETGLMYTLDIKPYKISQEKTILLVSSKLSKEAKCCLELLKMQGFQKVYLLSMIDAHDADDKASS